MEQTGDLRRWRGSGSPGEPTASTTTGSARMLTASKRLGYAVEVIASQENTVARDYHSYRKAEVVSKRSMATLAEWRLYKLELEMYMQESIVTGRFDVSAVAPPRTRLEAPSSSSSDVEALPTSCIEEQTNYAHRKRSRLQSVPNESIATGSFVTERSGCPGRPSSAPQEASPSLLPPSVS